MVPLVNVRPIVSGWRNCLIPLKREWRRVLLDHIREFGLCRAIPNAVIFRREELSGREQPTHGRSVKDNRRPAEEAAYCRIKPLPHPRPRGPYLKFDN